MYYVNRQELMLVLLGALEEEVPEKTKKERIVIAESIVEALDGPVLAVVDDEEEEDEDQDEPSYETE